MTVGVVVLALVASAGAPPGDAPPPGWRTTCAEPLAGVAAAPRERFGGGRRAAVEEAGLGEPQTVAIEIGPSRHDRDAMLFLPLVRFRMSYPDQIVLQYLQRASGGQELLEEVALLGAVAGLELPFRIGDSRAAIRVALGEPSDSDRDTWRYECPNELAEDVVELHFDGEQLMRVDWAYAID